MNSRQSATPYLVKWLKSNGFILGLIFAVFLAFLFPQLGSRHGALHAETVDNFGIAFILFLQGLSLAYENVRKGFNNWRLHLVIQTFTFVVFPIVGLLFNLLTPFIWPGEPPAIRDGFLYLCVLPSTISTSVVLTAVARGNTVGALFNAALSNILGVMLTPVLVSILLKSTGRQADFGPLLLQIMMLTLLPFSIGMIARNFVKEWIDARKKWVGRISSSIILFIVYTAFCDSIVEKIWDQYGLILTAQTFGLVMVLFITISLMVYSVCCLMGLNREDWIAAYFCSVKKTLAMGVPLAILIFGERRDISLILLPIMFYHPFQLFTNGILANLWQKSAPSNK